MVYNSTLHYNYKRNWNGWWSCYSNSYCNTRHINTTNYNNESIIFSLFLFFQLLNYYFFQFHYFFCLVECVVASDICFHPSLMSFELPRYGLPPRVTRVDDRCSFWIRQTILLLSFFSLSFISPHLDFHVKYSWKIKMGFQTSSFFFYQIWLSFFWLLFLPIIFFSINFILQYLVC